jgi:hypothetical protein
MSGSAASELGSWSGQNRPASILTRSAKSPNLDQAPRKSVFLDNLVLGHLVDSLLKQASVRLGRAVRLVIVGAK